MNNLLALLRRSHRPDAEALSALVDGRLDASRAQALQSHIAACAPCAARLDELQRVKTMLAAMPQANAPRSFRLRQADVEAPARPAPVFLPGLLRAMPAASGVAALAFVLVLATDFSTRGDGGGRMAALQSSDNIAASGARMESKAAEATADASGADGDVQSPDPDLAFDGADPTVTAGASLPFVAPEGDGEGLVPASSNLDGSITPEAGAARADALPPDATPAGGAIAEDSASESATGEGFTQGSDGLEAATNEAANDDEGGRTAFLAVEIIAAGIAIAAGAAYAVARGKRRVQS